MKILFDNEALRNDCNNLDLLVKRFGEKRARLLRRRLDDFFTAESMEDLLALPHVSITGNPEGPGNLALDLGCPFRLLFRLIRPPRHESGGGDWKKIDSMIILGISQENGKFVP